MDTLLRNTLDVPGASLYYEVRGRGRVVHMINGGPADADQFAPVAQALSGRYAVVTFDTRGNSRSRIHDPSADQSIDLEAADAHALLEAVTGEPAYVFGSSSGAMVGLELLRRYPDQVRMLVAHEPPLTELLPDAAEYRARAQAAYDAYRRDGVGAGMLTFLGNAGLQAPPPPDGAHAAKPPSEAMQHMARNAEHFLAHRVRQIGSYVPDLAALQAVSDRIVIGLGVETYGMLPECAHILAERLHSEVVEFPGDHGGFSSDPPAFANRLDALFSQND